MKGTNNDATYDLSRLSIINSDGTEVDITRETLSDSYCDDKSAGEILPLTQRMIDKYQLNDIELVVKLKRVNYYTDIFVEVIKSHS